MLNFRMPTTLFLALFYTMGVPAAAQTGDGAPAIPSEAERRQVVPFLEGTYVFLTAPRDSIKFEADIQPNFVIAQNFSDKLITNESLNERPRFAYSIVGTPRVRLRMIDARSAPVRTPSYMPKGTFTGLVFRGKRQPNGDDAARIGIWAGQLTVGHHSNGQDGCLFRTDVLVGDDCVGVPNLAQINTADGSFSTNYVRFGMRYRREWLKDVTSPEQRAAGFEEQIGDREITLGIDYERHFNTDSRVRPFYGLNRFAVTAAGAAQTASGVQEPRDRDDHRVLRGRAARLGWIFCGAGRSLLYIHGQGWVGSVRALLQGARLLQPRMGPIDLSSDDRGSLRPGRLPAVR